MTTTHDHRDLPRCPGCIHLMKFKARKRRTGGLPTLNMFECQRCGFVFTEADTGEAPIVERATALHLEEYTVRH